MSKKLNNEIINLVLDYLERPNKLYTGLAIKQFIKNNLLKSDKLLKNPSIQAGRWSSYCHYSFFSAFENILQKTELKPGQNILVSPLLPKSVIDQLLPKKFNLSSIDVEKDSLNWSKEKFLSNLSDQKDKPSLIINSINNGLTQDYLEIIKETNKQNIPQLVIITKPFLDFTLIELVNNLRAGSSVIYFYGDSFWDNYLDEVITGLPLQNNPWFISFYLETRTSSILEYHLSESRQYFIELLEAYLYLLNQKDKSLNWKYTVNQIQSNLKSIGLSVGALSAKKYKNKEEAEKHLRDAYQKTLIYALPDTPFELENKLGKFAKSLTVDQIVDKIHQFQSKAKGWYDFLNAQVSQQPAGSLEVPNFFLQRTYLQYHFYSTNKDYWHTLITQTGYNVQSTFAIHPIFLEKPELFPNTNFINKYLISIDLMT
jgi:hypothetical protein